MTNFLPDPGLPPNNVEAEEAILGGIITDPEAIARIDSVLKSTDFFVGQNGVLYQAVSELYRANHPVDLLGIADKLAGEKKLDALGGKKRLVDLAQRSLSAVNIDQYAQLVKDKARRRQLIEAGSTIARAGYEQSTPLAELFDKAESMVFGVTQDGQTGGAKTAEAVLDEIMAQTIERATTGVPPGIPTGFYDYDGLTQGVHRGELTIVAGRPAMGKSAWALTVASAIAAQNLPVLVYSLEMSDEQLMLRLLSAESRIDGARIRAGRIAQTEWEILAKARKTLSERPLLIDHQPAVTISEIRSRSREVMATRGHLGAIVIDYLQLMGGGQDTDRVKSLGAISRQLKQLARELNVPIIALSQLNRGVEARTNKRPQLSDLRDSGEIEENADLVVGLYRDEYYDPDSPDSGVAEVIILKHRSGPTGTVRLLFEADFTRFLNLAKPPKFTPKTSMHGGG